jgi:hypothetical protein
MKRTIPFLILFLLSKESDAQIFNSILREAQRKIEQKVADKLVDALAEEIAKKAFRPIEASMDSMMRKSYQDSVNHGEKVDWNKAGKAYGEFLRGMNEAVDLPEKYALDVRQEIEFTQYDEKKIDMVMYYSVDKPITAMETSDKKNESNLILMDMEKDVMVMYSVSKKGEKRAQTFANVSRFSKTMANSVQDSKTEAGKYKIKKTGKTKKVAGYACEEFILTSPEMEMTMYITTEFPIKWEQKSTAYMGQFTPEDYSMANGIREGGGIMLEYTSTQLEGKKQTSTWTTKSIKKETRNIVNSEYIFGMVDEK